jgi:predicted ATPase
MNLLPKDMREGISILEAPQPPKRGGGRPRKQTSQPSFAGMLLSAAPAVTINVFQPPTTTLFGRERERERAADLLRNPAVRILTLAGPGGVGKTRLAHALAADLTTVLPSAHIRSVPVADIRSVDALLNVIAGTVGASQRSIESAGNASATVADIARLLGQFPDRVILIVDNLEQVAHESAPILRELIGASPNLTCVLTSRQLLPPNSSGIIPIGERTLQVEPLPVPPTTLLEGARDSPVPIEAQLESWSSVALFVDRAKRHDPGFALTASNASALGMVVRRLEGLPLAIELAAARSQRFTPAHLLDSLENGFDEIALLSARTQAHRESVYARHDSLRQTIQWSFDLLPATRQRVFAALSVFRGGFAVEEVITTLAEEPGMDSTLVFDAVADLCSASLLRRLPIEDVADTLSSKLLPPRYDMLEPIREFASKQLTSVESASIPARHAATYEALALNVRNQVQKQDSAWWLQRGGLEQGNFRAALSWAAVTQNREAARLGISLATSLDYLYQVLGNVTEGRVNLRTAMAHPFAPSAVDVTAEANAYNRAGVLAMTQGDMRDAVVHYETALRLWRSAGNKAGIAGALTNLAIIAGNEQRLDDAWERLTECLTIWRQLDFKSNIAITTANLGNLALDRNDLVVARELIEEAIPLARAAGDNRGAAISMRNLGELFLRQGDVAAACRQYVAALEITLVLRDIQGCAASLLGLGVVAELNGRGRRSVRLVQTALRAYHALSIPAPAFFRLAFPAVDFEVMPGKIDAEEAAHAVFIMGRVELEMAADEAELPSRPTTLPLSRTNSAAVGTPA